MSRRPVRSPGLLSVAALIVLALTATPHLALAPSALAPLLTFLFFSSPSPPAPALTLAVLFSPLAPLSSLAPSLLVLSHVLPALPLPPALLTTILAASLPAIHALLPPAPASLASIFLTPPLVLNLFPAILAVTPRPNSSFASAAGVLALLSAPFAPHTLLPHLLPAALALLPTHLLPNPSHALLPPILATFFLTHAPLYRALSALCNTHRGAFCAVPPALLSTHPTAAQPRLLIFLPAAASLALALALLYSLLAPPIAALYAQLAAALTPLTDALAPHSPTVPASRRPHTLVQRFGVALAYYLTMAAFMWAVWRYSWPGLVLGSRGDSFCIDVARFVSILSLPAMAMNVVGHIIFPVPVKRAIICPSGGDDRFVLYVRYVTRGNNRVLVARNAREAAVVLARAGVAKDGFVVEVVTDAPLGLVGDVVEIVVPGEYRAASGALFKARALNYAIGASEARGEDWVLHLDEETRFDEVGAVAVMAHCRRESGRAAGGGRARIGQGPIMYGRPAEGGDIGNWVTTLADSMRVSDDLGRYRLQFSLGEVWVGMHGSFVVAPNCVEKDVTFDHGVEGSIAEDAFFALVARSTGVRFAWVDAFMYEQSPFSLSDFVKQRARWLVGGFNVISSPKIEVVRRAAMAPLVSLWAMMPFTYIGLLLAITFPSAREMWYYHGALPAMAAISLWSYLVGFLVTYRLRDLGVWRYLTLLYLQMALTPVFGMMEVAAVVYGLANYHTLAVGFHVVRKEEVLEEVSSRISDCSVDETAPLLGVEV